MSEATLFIEKEIFSKLPLNISKTEKKKFIKNRFKELFHIEWNKYPRWIQSAEWPIRNDTPCKYIKQRKIGEKIQYIFQDINSGEKILIEQFY